MMCRVLGPAILLVMGCAGGSPRPATNPAPAKPRPTSPCTTRVHKQWDFWLGSWSVATPAGALAGSNRIIKEHRGCVLIENWTSARGGTGVSTNYYDPAKKKWVQNWADGTGGIIQLQGGLRGPAMHLTGSYVQSSGAKSKLRGTWTPLPDGRVRQLFEESKDGGSTWTVWFDGYYSRAK